MGRLGRRRWVRFAGALPRIVRRRHGCRREQLGRPAVRQPARRRLPPAARIAVHPWQQRRGPRPPAHGSRGPASSSERTDRPGRCTRLLGRPDFVVFRPSNRTWYLRGIAQTRFGQPGDVPAAADYNGDGKADIAVYRPDNGTWLIRGISVTAWAPPATFQCPLTSAATGGPRSPYGAPPTAPGTSAASPRRSGAREATSRSEVRARRGPSTPGSACSAPGAVAQ